MEYGLSTRLFSTDRLNSRHLDRILEAGFRHIELFAAPEHFDYRERNHVGDIAHWFEDLGVNLHSVHAPPYSEAGGARGGGFQISISHPQRRLRIDSMDEIKRTMEVAERLPFRYLVLHLGLEHETYSLENFDAAFTSLEHLRIFGKERGVRILLENAAGELNRPEKLVQFLNYTHLDDMGICFDAGHAHLDGSVHDNFSTVRERVSAVHLHDNRGERDEHLLPFEIEAGGVDWSLLVPNLAEAARNRNFCSLLEPQDRGQESASLEHVRGVIRKFEAMEDNPRE